MYVYSQRAALLKQENNQHLKSAFSPACIYRQKAIKKRMGGGKINSKQIKAEVLRRGKADPGISKAMMNNIILMNFNKLINSRKKQRAGNIDLI